MEPVDRLNALRLPARGRVNRVEAEILSSKLPRHIAAREAGVLAEALGIENDSIRRRFVEDSAGPGNVVTVTVTSESITEVFAGFGRRGVRAERVAAGVAGSVERYLAADVPVGIHLADQLLVPLALAGGGSFTTLLPSAHTLTNIVVIGQFLPLDIRCAATADTDKWSIEILRR